MPRETNTRPPDFTYAVKSMGSVREGEFAQKPLTVFCGLNNTGKTWVLYSLYHYLKSLAVVREMPGEFGIEVPDNETLAEFVPDLESLNQSISSELAFFFNSSSFISSDTSFGLTNQANLGEAISFAETAKPFLMPAERTGLHLIFRELNARRTSLLHRLSRPTVEPQYLLRDVILSPYAGPVADYIDWLNNLWKLQENPAVLYRSHASWMRSRLLNGGFRLDRDTGSIEFRPYKTGRGDPPTKVLGLHVTSSAVKSLFGLWFYLTYQATPGSVLMIDEPELNLHPARQRLVARLLARLVNQGIYVVLSTHSDYIVREFNILVMLSHKKAKNLRRRHRYRDDEVLDPAGVGAYHFENNTIKKFETTQEGGINASTFDHIIEEMNESYNDIYFALRYGHECDTDD